VVPSSVSHYKILEKLGEGGMGVVYKAQDTKLDRFVALKFLPSHVASSSEDKARFLQEAKAAAALNHNNICTIYGVDESDGTMFIAMEFIEGGILREKIPFARIDDALTIAMQIGEALQEAHTKGIVHRDVKADNVMLTSRGQAKVMDFGLAKLKGSLKLTKTSSTIGTLAYMAPEQIQGGDVDNRSDIFSFGVLLFEMLTGKLPFRGEHEAAMVYSIVNDEPENIQKYRSEVSAELTLIIEKALEKDPNDRYQTVADMVVDLRRVRKQSTKVSREHARPSEVAQTGGSTLTSSPAEPTPALRQQPGKSFPSKYKWWIAVGIVAVLIVAALAVRLLRGNVPELNPGMTTRVLEIPLTDIGYPGLSGDGNWTAFVAKDAGGKWHLYFMNTGGGEPKAITTESLGSNSAVDLSPDGSRVAYDGGVTGRDRSDIFLTSALGGGTSLIAQGGAVPLWQPDGKRIFYFSGFYWSTSSLRKLEVRSVTPEGTEGRLEFVDTISVPARYSLSLSPDGKSVVWLRTFPEGNYQEVVVHDLVTGAERQLTFNKKNCDEVCWASNDQIIFSSNRGGNTNLWMVPAEGGEQVQITHGLGPDLGIKISTDLKRLLYYERQDIGDFWIGSTSTGTTGQITFDDRRKFWPSLSPDGKLIAFAMYGADLLTWESAIYVSNRDGSNRRQLASNAGMILHSQLWSPDGSRIAYAARNPSLPDDSSLASKTYVIEPARTAIPRFIADGSPFVWLNADSVMVTNAGKSWLAVVSTGQVNQFFEDSTAAYPVRGGKSVLYYDYHQATRGVWIVDVDRMFKRTGTARRLNVDDRKDGYTYWTLSPSRDFVMLRKPGGKLLKIWLSSGKEELIPGTFSNIDDAENVSLSPGTNEFIYDVRRTKGRLVMIENMFN